MAIKTGERVQRVRRKKKEERRKKKEEEKKGETN